jgi:ubiquitin-associated and SH3 domain-containing protein
MRSLADDGKYLNRPLDLDLYTSSNFMGYFVREDDANVLKRIALKFVKEVSDSSKLKPELPTKLRCWRPEHINFSSSTKTLIDFPTVISDTIDLDHLIACFPYCASAVNQKTSSRCIPKSSRCKIRFSRSCSRFIIILTPFSSIGS